MSSRSEGFIAEAHCTPESKDLLLPLLFTQPCIPHQQGLSLGPRP